jgi:hypothetical protein
MPLNVKIKGKKPEKPQPQTAAEESLAPPEIEALFQTLTRTTHRRSMQLSVPDPAMSVMISLQNKVVGVSFSVATRQIWTPYLDVLRDILRSRDYLNEFGNISVPLPDLVEIIKMQRLEYLREYVMLCKERNLDISWIKTSEL